MVDTVIIPSLQIKNMRPREIIELSDELQLVSGGDEFQNLGSLVSESVR